MKTSRFQFQYRKNASSLHKAVGEILRLSPAFQNSISYQEYPVSKINPTYEDNSHHFDWVIPKLKIVIECHGKQHYEATSFTSNDDEAVSSFSELKRRDNLKKKAAIEAGFTYVVVPFYDEKLLSQAYLLKCIESATVAIDPPILDKRDWRKERRKEYLKSDKHKKELSTLREMRKQKYRALKEKNKGEQNE